MSKETTTNVQRRGIASARGAGRKRFSHQDSKANGLFIAHLDDIKVEDVEFGEEVQGTPSFAGIKVPKITFTFASNEENPVNRRYVDFQLMAVESNVETANPKGKNAWQVTSILDWFNHIIEVYYCKGVNIVDKLTPEWIKKLELDLTDFDYEKNEYIVVEPEVVVEAWRKLFLNFVEFMNTGNDGKPIYKNKDGVSYPIWLKLLRYNKSGRGKNAKWRALADGELAVPRFVAGGVIELYKAGQAAFMRLNPISERIEPMKLEEPKAPTAMPGMPTGGIMVDPYNSGASEMPFPDGLEQYEEAF